MRGFTGNVIIVDELAYISQEFFLKVIVPMMTLRNLAFIGASTPRSAVNLFSVLEEMYDFRSLPFMHVVRISNACLACEKTGNIDIIDKCTHNAVTWTSPNKCEIKKK